MNRKMLSINLWYHIYSAKTDAQLKSFRRFGYLTHVFTITKEKNMFSCQVYNITDKGKEAFFSASFRCGILNLSFFSIFKCMFQYIIENHYSFVYMRRLMSKLFFAAPYFKMLSMHVPIIYELPTYPFDKTNDFLYKIRDFLELKIFFLVEKYITQVLVVLRSNVPVKSSWIVFSNSIDISNYSLSAIPPLEHTIEILAVSNMAVWHRYDRLLQSIYKYTGNYSIHLTMVSRDTPAYQNIKQLAHSLKLEDKIHFLSDLPLSEIANLSSTMHIGVGNLTYKESGIELISSLKTKDYCAMGLPFFSSCKDTCFPAVFPYHYLIDNSTYEIDLNSIIHWYEQIRLNTHYREEMYHYAEKNLQFDSVASRILNSIKLSK